ncbi:PadR family transcriptional regulator [Halegenticoccus tardaugens]|uniref:PadR family transcriptional regulator n=1 Tax=Halegenticoccus tardaugens TaxID=2071624 RepID=UPI00100B3D5C|nr:PadR family transcriptional regulator [Halegenticoccus tardaugens]
MFDLTGFQRDLLIVISGSDEPSGQDIKDDLEDAYGDEINHGQLYPNLDVLVENEYVEKGEIDRRTNSYAISDQGREILREWIDWSATHSPQLAQ